MCYDRVGTREGDLVGITLKAPEPVTDEGLLEFSRRNPGLRFERSAGGELIVTPAGSRSARRELQLGAQLEHWARRDGRGLAFGPSAGFRLPDGSVLAPDAAWVRRERWDALTDEEQEGFAPLCPDVVFEIASKTDDLRDLRAKVRRYLTNGAHVALLIDPQSLIVEIYRPGQEPQVLSRPQAVTLTPELPGFTLDVAPIFES